MPRLDDSPGATLRLMVVSTGNRHCAGIDLASGALVRAWSSYLVDQRIRPYDIVEVTVGTDLDLLPDPAQPDAVVTAGPPKLAGHVRDRPAARLIRSLLHPDKAPLLGTYGATVPFWERSPDHPSITIAQPKGPLVVTLEEERMWCHFFWSGRPHVLGCEDPRLEGSLRRGGRTFGQMKPGSYLIIALSPPIDGHCYKVVEAVVARH